MSTKGKVSKDGRAAVTAKKSATDSSARVERKRKPMERQDKGTGSVPKVGKKDTGSKSRSGGGLH